MSLAHFWRMIDLSLAVLSLQDGNAVWASCMAFCVSEVEHLGTSPIISPLAGLSTLIFSPESLSIHFPPIKQVSLKSALFFSSIFTSSYLCILLNYFINF